jgi:lipoprotein NlpD
LDYRQFAAWNHIRSPYRIHPGQYLRVVGPPAASSTAANRATIKPAQESSSRLATPSNTKTVPKNRTIARNESYSPLKLRWQWPTNGRVKTTFQRGDHTRKGVMLSGSLGQDVKAAEAGTVVYSGSGLVGYGQLIIIKHNKNYLSAYGHNQKLLVKEGDRVKKGTHIADMGKNGSGSVVLHFEIRRNGVPVDPLSLLPRKS